MGMRKFILTAFISLFTFSASAQFYVGGSVAGAYAKQGGSDSEAWAYQISPEIGFMIKNRLAIGARLSYGKANAKVESTWVNFSEAGTSAFTVNPYLEWGMLRFGDFAVRAELGALLVPEQESTSSASVAGYLLPVLTYNLGSRFLLKTNLNCAGIAVYADSEDNVILSGGAGTTNALNMGDLSIGFIILF